MNGPDSEIIAKSIVDLIDDYCADLIDEAGLRVLEAELIASAATRRYFVEYLQLHAELGFSSRARRAASQALQRFEKSTTPVRGLGLGLGRGRLRVSRRTMAAAAVLIAGSGYALGHWGWNRRVTPMATRHAIAWLNNAQDCLWADDAPGRDMVAGKVLRLDRGLAEIEFERGARVILKGPSTLELISDNEARLIKGSMTARVPVPAHGFTVQTPQGQVVDLGTEFGLAIDDPATTSVHVFEGELTAASGVEGAQPPIHLVKDQAARIGDRAVSVRDADPLDPSRFARAIVPPPIFRPRTLKLDFAQAVEGTLSDAEGRGIGLTRRLPGTGSSLLGRDGNLRLRPDSKVLELTTTRSDLNKQVGLDQGEYLGCRLADLGFTGSEDFTISAEFPNIPGLAVVGQFGLYVGSKSDRAIRGGVIRQPEDNRYSLFLVNNEGGIDLEINEVGLTSTGDDLRFTLNRVAGKYSLLVENLTRKSSSTLTIPPSPKLDDEGDLYVGIFGANTQSDVRKTLTIQGIGVTVQTRASPPSARSATADSGGARPTPHPNPPPQGGRGPEEPEKRLRAAPSPLVGEGWGGG